MTSVKSFRGGLLYSPLDLEDSGRTRRSSADGETEMTYTPLDFEERRSESGLGVGRYRGGLDYRPFDFGEPTEIVAPTRPAPEPVVTAPPVPEPAPQPKPPRASPTPTRELVAVSYRDPDTKLEPLYELGTLYEDKEIAMNALGRIAESGEIRTARQFSALTPLEQYVDAGVKDAGHEPNKLGVHKYKGRHDKDVEVGYTEFKHAMNDYRNKHSKAAASGPAPGAGT
jgi:hypothetical protein